jgi:hypothetical protein
MPDLLSLPTELLLRIFDDLYSHRPRMMLLRVPLIPTPESDCDYRAAYRTLAALARTCQLLRPIATEALYKRCISSFYRLPAAFTHQFGPNHIARRDIRYTEILQDHRARCLPGYKRTDRRRVLAAIAQETGQWRQKAQEEAQHEFCKTVLALLVAKSGNLEIFVMKSGEYDPRAETQERPPVWLLPILEVMQQVQAGITTNAKYERLHTMDLDLGHTYSSNVAYIFTLPQLRKLRL